MNDMNGFKIIADSYRQLMEKGKIEREVAEKEIRVLDFLATCDTDDFCRMVDSAAFNDIIKGYVRLAAENAGIDKKAQQKVVDQCYWIFDMKTAKEVLEFN